MNHKLSYLIESGFIPLTLETLEINEHLSSDLYPEYWVNGATIQHVWVNDNASYASDLSQLCGMILGLTVVNAA